MFAVISFNDKPVNPFIGYDIAWKRQLPSPGTFVAMAFFNIKTFSLLLTLKKNIK